MEPILLNSALFVNILKAYIREKWIFYLSFSDWGAGWRKIFA